MNDCITTNNKTVLRHRFRSGQHFKIYEIRLCSSALLLLPHLYTSSFSLQDIKQITLLKDLLKTIKFCLHLILMFNCSFAYGPEKRNPSAYIFQRPFMLHVPLDSIIESVIAVGGVLFEGLIFGGAHIGGEICVSKSIGLAYS